MRMAHLARLIGVDKATVTRWSQKEVPVERVPDIVAATGIPAEELRPDLATVFASPTPERAS